MTLSKRIEEYKKMSVRCGFVCFTIAVVHIEEGEHQQVFLPGETIRGHVLVNSFEHFSRSFLTCHFLTDEQLKSFT